jgi:hypothetical protein
MLVSCGFDGLAAVQHRSNDLTAIRKTDSHPLVLMGGIDAGILEQEALSPLDMEAYVHFIKSFSPGSGLILSSCCGLYRGEFLEKIQELYKKADEILRG